MIGFWMLSLDVQYLINLLTIPCRNHLFANLGIVVDLELNLGGCH